jgi:hypothetical protein
MTLKPTITKSSFWLYEAGYFYVLSRLSPFLPPLVYGGGYWCWKFGEITLGAHGSDIFLILRLIMIARTQWTCV